VYIKSAKIRTYKNYLETGVFPLSPGFNVVVGQNNAGKTALIEALSLRFGNVPHRSLATVPNRLVEPPHPSVVDMQVIWGKEELLSVLVDQVRNIYVPTDPVETYSSAITRFSMDLSDANQLNISSAASAIRNAWLEFHGPSPSNSHRCLEFTIQQDEQEIKIAPQGIASATSDRFVGPRLAAIVQDRIYVFRAERMNIGSSAFGQETRLLPNAANLPEVLSVLQSTNAHRYNRFNEHVSTIFPQITRVSVVPRPNNRVEILIWSVPVETERDDLAIPLAESGTGISQVLAIIYVVMTANFPQILLIDEPQSFLHPGAVRKLIEILKVHYPQHQYVLTTHSPHVISASDPGTLLLVKRGVDQSTVESISPAVANQMNAVLSEVGARLSDVFGVDSMIWVEGPTEEQCFPMILHRVAKRPLLGTALLAVEHTGDFETKRAQFAERSFAIYSRLSEGTGLVPPALAFIFDREGRTLEQMDALRRRGKEKVHFLPKRLYENYLLNSEAIAACTSEIKDFRPDPVTADEVEQWIETRRWDKKYFSEAIPKNERNRERWLRDVHGAKLLGDLYSDLSEQRVTYQKTTHSVALTRWLVEHKSEAFREIADLLSEILDKQAPNQQ
jgi:ABC-type cobalamin/Fe3+-siderophores transport system ATPase subunit